MANVLAANVGIDRFGRCASSTCSVSVFIAISAAACAGIGRARPVRGEHAVPTVLLVRPGESDREVRIEAAARPPVRLGAVVRGAHPEELDRHRLHLSTTLHRGRTVVRLRGPVARGLSLLVLGSVITARE